MIECYEGWAPEDCYDCVNPFLCRIQAEDNQDRAERTCLLEFSAGDCVRFGGPCQSVIVCRMKQEHHETQGLPTEAYYEYMWRHLYEEETTFEFLPYLEQVALLREEPLDKALD